MAQFLVLTFSLLLLLMPVSKSYAHPHFLVEVKLDLHVDSAGHLLALEQRWFFDEMVSSILIEDMPSFIPGNPLPSALLAESQRISSDLAPYHYYTNLELSQRAVTAPKLASPNLKLIPMKSSNKEQGITPFQIVYGFRLEWPTPPLVLDKELLITVYDPTYYSAYRFRSLPEINISAPSNIQCQKQVIEPTPDDDLISYAFSLDQSKRDSQGLGVHFAEKLRIKCRSKTDS